MKILYRGGLLFLAVVAPLFATTYELSPAAIAGWSLSGANALAGAEDNSFSIPPSTRVTRTFVAQGIFLAVTSRPMFAANPGESALLEFGAATLAFVRNGERGEIVFFEKEEPTALPFDLALDQDGRSQKALDIVLLREEAELTIAVGDRAVRIPMAGQAAQTKIAVVSGATPWSVSRFLVDVPEPGPASADQQPVQTHSGDNDPERVERLRRALEAFGPSQRLPRGSGVTIGRSVAPGGSVSPSSDRPGLELFSLPAVRVERVNTISDSESSR